MGKVKETDCIGECSGGGKRSQRVYPRGGGEVADGEGYAAAAWKERYISNGLTVFADGDEILLGVIYLEAMGLLVNSVDRCVECVHSRRCLALRCSCCGE